MAHSLRSKQKLRAKSVKRVKEFQTAVDERVQRVHLRAKLDLLKQKKALGEKVEEEKEGEEAMAVDEEPKKTVSTSGSRGSRHQQIKLKKGKKNTHMNFKLKVKQNKK